MCIRAKFICSNQKGFENYISKQTVQLSPWQRLAKKIFKKKIESLWNNQSIQKFPKFITQYFPVVPDKQCIGNTNYYLTKFHNSTKPAFETTKYYFQLSSKSSKNSITTLCVCVCFSGGEDGECNLCLVKFENMTMNLFQKSNCLKYYMTIIFGKS